MRWSGALEWLTEKAGVPGIPGLDGAGVRRRDLNFEGWYADHSELREREKFAFVSGARHETVITRLSEPREFCGFQYFGGGVSLADSLHRAGDESWRPSTPLPREDDRAGLYDSSSKLDPATGDGEIGQVRLDEQGGVDERVDRSLTHGKRGDAVTETTGQEGRGGFFGGLKVWRKEKAQRKLHIAREAGGGYLSERITFQGSEWGRLVAQSTGGRVVLSWVRGPLERVRLALQSYQEKGEPARDSVLFRYGDCYKVGGGTDSAWFRITGDVGPPGDGMEFRLGRPDGRGAPEFFLGLPVSVGPDGLPIQPRPPPARSKGWWEFPVRPSGSPSRAVIGDPSHGARQMYVEDTGGHRSDVRWDDNRVWVRLDDQKMGPRGTAEAGAFLREFDQILAARQEAVAAHDGLARGVPLGEDGTAIVGADKVVITPADGPFGVRVREALGTDPARSRPRIGVEAGHPVHHGQGRIIPGAGWREMELGELAKENNVLVDGKLYPYVINDGLLSSDWPKRRQKVTVQKAMVEVTTAAESPGVLADAYQQQNGRGQSTTWLRVTGPGGRPGNSPVPWRPFPPVTGPSESSSPTPPPSPSPSGQARPGTVLVPVLLACPAAGDRDHTCVP